jgi:hypothetical protein
MRRAHFAATLAALALSAASSRPGDSHDDAESLNTEPPMSKFDGVRHFEEPYYDSPVPTNTASKSARKAAMAEARARRYAR